MIFNHGCGTLASQLW